MQHCTTKGVTLPPPPQPFTAQHRPEHTGSTHGRVVEQVYAVTGAMARPLLPKGSLRITDASGRLVCDLTDQGAAGGPATAAPSFTTSSSTPAAAVAAATAAAVASRRASRGGHAALAERAEAKAYWGKVVMHQVRACVRACVSDDGEDGSFGIYMYVY